MAALGGATEVAVTPFTTGRPACSVVQGPSAQVPAADLLPPSGGLIGSLAFINLNNGIDVGASAVALEDLATAPFYRNYNDAYPDFGIIEVKPVSLITTGGVAYKLTWTSGVDAVTSVLMSTRILNEYQSDPAVSAQTDWVVTFPTKRFYPGGLPPFVDIWSDRIGSPDIILHWFNRASKEAATASGCDMGGVCGGPPTFVAASVLPILAFEVKTSPVFGSRNLMTQISGLPATFHSGWAMLEFSGDRLSMTSLPDSRALELATGKQTTGSFVVQGQPAVGFMARTFNGSSCVRAPCQGLSAAFTPHRYVRSVEPSAP